MTIKERMRYQASWGAWYVQVDTDWGVVELKFDKEPNAKVLATAVGKLKPPEPVKTQELVELTVDDAIAFLNEKYVSDSSEKAKIQTFITDKTAVVKPVVGVR